MIRFSVWQRWERFFSRRASRSLPRLRVTDAYSSIPSSVARSLAIFQLGESGGGSIVRQAAHAQLPGIDAHFARSMAHFVAEENRHAELLAMCVRMLGGELKKKNWTATWFVRVRRLIGLRFKVTVLLAAEVVGLCYYQLLASRLPRGQVRSLLRQIAADERGHLDFHCQFLRTQCAGPVRRGLFVVTWRAVMLAAALAVLIDHRAAVADLGIPLRRVWRLWWGYANLAEGTVRGFHPIRPPEFSDKLTSDEPKPRYCVYQGERPRAPAAGAWYRPVRNDTLVAERSLRVSCAALAGQSDMEEQRSKWGKAQWGKALTSRSSSSRATSCGDG